MGYKYSTLFRLSVIGVIESCESLFSVHGGDKYDKNSVRDASVRLYKVEY